MVRKALPNTWANCDKCLGMTPHDELSDGKLRCRYCGDTKPVENVQLWQEVNQGCSPKRV